MSTLAHKDLDEAPSDGTHSEDMGGQDPNYWGNDDERGSARRQGHSKSEGKDVLQIT